MIENGFYKVKQDYIDLIRTLGGTYKDAKERPVFCCFEDQRIVGLYWAIPTSDLSHRTPDQIANYQKYCSLSEKDIRSAYYFIGHTNKPALYRISCCFPIIDKYIDGPYFSNGSQLMLKSTKDIQIIRAKLSRILFDEDRHPDKYEQHKTTIKNYLSNELK